MSRMSVLHASETWPSVWAPADDSHFHETASRLHMEGHRDKHALSFLEFCPESYHCVSKLSKMGEGHDGAAKPPRDKNPDDKDIYEDMCPLDGSDGEVKWNGSEKKIGTGRFDCKDETDCLCVSCPEFSEIVTKHGLERIGHCMAVVNKSGKTMKKTVDIMPHFDMRLLPDTVNPVNPDTDLGQVGSFSRTAWMKEYQTQAPRLQNVLDDLRSYIRSKYHESHSKTWKCGEKPPEGSADKEPAFNKEQAGLMLSAIRRFRILSDDCAEMRDNMEALEKPAKEQFARTSPWPAHGDESVPPHIGFRSIDPKKKVQGNDLNCYVDKSDEKHCKTLNCYDQFSDQKLLTEISELKSQLNGCAPSEPETLLSEPETLLTAANLAFPISKMEWTRRRQTCHRTPPRYREFF